MPPPLTEDALLGSHRAPPERSLVDIFARTVDSHPESPAIDNGREVLTYEELMEAAERVAEALRLRGVGPGDRVGVRIPSGTSDLYVAILGILVAGAAYVPVDAEDPDERAQLVFGEAGVAAVVGADLVVVRGEHDPVGPRAARGPDDDAWVIFTSGSTGTPKGVAVSHRSAAAFVDAESRIFLQDSPISGAPEQTAPREVFVGAVAREIRRSGLQRQVVVQSFDWGALRTMNGLLPTVPLVALTNIDFLQVGRPGASPWLGGLDADDFGGDFVAAADAIPGVRVLSPVHGTPQAGRIGQAGYRFYTDADMVQRAHERGLQVVPWTVDDPATMEALIDAGVDGLITDYPDALREVLRVKDVALPRPAPAKG